MKDKLLNYKITLCESDSKDISQRYIYEGISAISYDIIEQLCVATKNVEYLLSDDFISKVRKDLFTQCNKKRVENGLKELVYDKEW